jgi:von Willebrand factor type D domain
MYALLLQMLYKIYCTIKTKIDPHFRTYDGTMYSFHGQCDLVMARSQSFDNGLGLELHARTEIVTDWSLIKNAALKIGTDVFELANDGSHYFNGDMNVDLATIQLAGKYPVSKKVEMIEVTTDEDNKTYQEPKLLVTIHLGDDNKAIQMQVWKNMMSVEVDIHLDDTEGMLGTHSKEGMIGRDRETLAVDGNDMGFQWQVQDTEPRLFHAEQTPQFPQQCMLPSIQEQQRRRLQKVSTEFVQTAEDVCALISSADLRPFCVKDVILTGDINVARGYAF